MFVARVFSGVLAGGGKGEGEGRGVIPHPSSTMGTREQELKKEWRKVREDYWNAHDYIRQYTKEVKDLKKRLRDDPDDEVLNERFYYTNEALKDEHQNYREAKKRTQELGEEFKALRESSSK